MVFKKLTEKCIAPSESSDYTAIRWSPQSATFIQTSDASALSRSEFFFSSVLQNLRILSLELQDVSCAVYGKDKA